jgi:hypothetical protein
MWTGNSHLSYALVLQCSAFFPLTDENFASWPMPYLLGEPRNATTAPDSLFGHALSCNRNAQACGLVYIVYDDSACLHHVVTSSGQLCILLMGAFLLPVALLKSLIRHTSELISVICLPEQFQRCQHLAGRTAASSSQIR